MVARCVVMACTIIPAVCRKRESELASGITMLTVMAESWGMLRKVIFLSSRPSLTVPRGARRGRFLW